MNDKLVEIVKSNRQLFWDIGEKDLSSLNKEAIVERIMAYGDMQDIYDLEGAITRSQLKKTFEKIKNKRRVNLEPETVNFFNIYLSKDAS